MLTKGKLLLITTLLLLSIFVSCDALYQDKNLMIKELQTDCNKLNIALDKCKEKHRDKDMLIKEYEARLKKCKNCESCKK